MSDVLEKHVVEVFPEKAGTDEYGNTIVRPGAVTDTPVSFRCSVQSSTTDEDASLGLQVGSTRRLLSRADFPGGAQSLVRWDGRLWDVLGEPKPYIMSPGTKHQTTYITARTPRAV